LVLIYLKDAGNRCGVALWGNNCILKQKTAMKILIIGASGLLARPVIRYFDSKGFHLRLFSRSVNPSMFDKEFEIVRGDVFNPVDLDQAMNGCDAVHITLSRINEAEATRVIINVAKQKEIKLVSIVSGCTVAEENRWFPMIENKFQAEQAVINSGIPYMIFRPTWFFESLDLMIRNGKATVLGTQPNPYHWVAADDYARMVTTAYQKPEAANNIFYVYGPQSFLMKDLLEKYCKVFHPEIKKVSSVPLALIKIIATLTGKGELKNAAALFAYFEKVKEPADPSETSSLLGKSGIIFEEWMERKKSGQV
jgi:uncharacterized protein YbjT (DUF2867 family)